MRKVIIRTFVDIWRNLILLSDKVFTYIQIFSHCEKGSTTLRYSNDANSLKIIYRTSDEKHPQDNQNHRQKEKTINRTTQHERQRSQQDGKKNKTKTENT